MALDGEGYTVYRQRFILFVAVGSYGHFTYYLGCQSFLPVLSRMLNEAL